MKNIRVFSFCAFTFLFAFSCSDDNGGDNNDGFDSTALIGTWDLVEVNLSAAVDLDDDGESSTNLMDEAGCISGTIVFNTDSTYQYEQSNFSITTITNGKYHVDCYGTTLATGAWASNGIEVAFQGSSALGNLQLNSNTIVKEEGEELPGVATYVYKRR